MVEEDKEKIRQIKEGKPGESEKTEYVEDLRPPTYETLFESKKPVKLETLFEEQISTSPKRAVIFGAAGIGKSTFCQHIAYRWAKGELWQEYVLIWVRLRNLQPDDSPTSFLQKEIQAEYLNKALEDETLSKQILLVLDGYDELPKGCDRVFEQIKKQLNNTHLLVTSRPMPVNMNGPRLEILGFHSKDIPVYIGQFFNAMSKREITADQAARNGLKLKTLLESQFLLKSLCHIPINLTMLCTLFCDEEEIVNFDTPLTMTALYDRLVNWAFKRFLLRQGESEADVREREDTNSYNDTNEKLQNFLEQLAWEATKKNQLYVSQALIEKKLNSNMIRELKKLGLLRVEDKIGYFVHLTFQEFFAASYLARLFDTCLEEARKELESFKFNPRYALVLRMVAGILSIRSNNVGPNHTLKTFFCSLFSEPRDLAFSYELKIQASCFEECDNPTNIDQYRIFIDRVVSFMEVCSYGQLIVNLFKSNRRLIGQKKVIDVFKNLTLNNEKTIFILEELANSGQPLPLEALREFITLASDPNLNKDIKFKAVMTLRRLAENRQDLPAEILVELKTLNANLNVDRDTQFNPWMSLSRVIESRQPLSPKPQEELINLVVSNPSAYDRARCEAADELVKMAKKGQSLPPDLLENLVALIFESNINSSVKHAVANLLGGLAESEQALPQQTLKALVGLVSDPKVEPYVRTDAANALRSVVKRNPTLFSQTIESLVALAINVQVDNDVKSSLVLALGRIIEGSRQFSQRAMHAIAFVVTHKNTDLQSKYMGAFMFTEIAKVGQPFLQEAMRQLIWIVSRAETDYVAKVSAASALIDIGKRGQPLLKEAPEALMSILAKDSKIDDEIKLFAADSLIAAILTGQSIPHSVLENFAFFISNPEADEKIKCKIAKVLRKITKNKLALSEKALKKLINLTSDLNADYINNLERAKALKAVAKNGYELPLDAIKTLVSLLDSEDTIEAIKALKEVVQGVYHFPEKALLQLFELLNKIDYQHGLEIIETVLDKIVEKWSYTWGTNNYKPFAAIFFLTGHALFYREGKLYAFKKDRQDCLGDTQHIADQLKNLKIGDFCS